MCVVPYSLCVSSQRQNKHGDMCWDNTRGSVKSFFSSFRPIHPRAIYIENPFSSSLSWHQPHYAVPPHSVFTFERARKELIPNSLNINNFLFSARQSDYCVQEKCVCVCVCGRGYSAQRNEARRCAPTPQTAINKQTSVQQLIIGLKQLLESNIR